MTAHVACRPNNFDGHVDTGCFVVCAGHDLRIAFGTSHEVAVAACREHNLTHHPKSVRNRPALLSVVYRSRQAAGVSEPDVADLLLRARHANAAFGITGMLLAEDGRFLQALEGPELVVRSLVASIVRDPRHEQVEVLAEDIVSTRRFPDWAMAHGHITDVEAHPLREYFGELLLARGRA